MNTLNQGGKSSTNLAGLVNWPTQHPPSATQHVWQQNGRHPHEHDDSDDSSLTSSHRRGSDSEEDSSPRRESASADYNRPIASTSSFPELMPIAPHWAGKRHSTCGNPSPPQPGMPKSGDWRLRDKLRTTQAALVLCLNVDVDPPDVVKTQPCAVLECWVDPHSLPSNKALEAIGTNLHQQFESLNPRMKYKPYLDPSIDDLRKFTMNLRKLAKEDRTLFYYNGHGVPKPTPSGELWVFNKSYSQYIPVSLFDIQTWLGSPCIYIWDCSAAGNLVTNFIKFAERRDEEERLRPQDPGNYFPFLDSIQLAACKADEQLPMCPELPADLFTSCLTSPIEIALRYFSLHNQLPSDVTPDHVMQVPGDIKDRRTPLGELNWIFTAVTDTIAWTTFPRHIFRRLYRQDLLVAALFRNFLLAERVMKSYQCTPHTYPELPATNTHPIWAAWDLALDGVIKQLPQLLAGEKNFQRTSVLQPGGIPNAPQASNRYQYIPSKFFEQNLTAFEVWLARGGSALTKPGPMSLAPEAADPPERNLGSVAQRTLALSAREEIARRNLENASLVPRKPPAQLPILLQVLLSQAHRLRALILLSQFMDLGPWAVNLALTIGIFPYVQKLLQAPAVELRPVLIFIWTRLLAVDRTCQIDLLNCGGYNYFVNVLAVDDTPGYLMIDNDSEHRAMCAFVLSMVSRDYPEGQAACWKAGVFDNISRRLEDNDFLARQWAALCIAQMWDGNDEIREVGRDTTDKLLELVKDDAPEVRAAAVYALGTFMGASGSSNEKNLGGGGAGRMSTLDEKSLIKMEIAIATDAILKCKEDASPMVRKEAVVLLSCIVKEWRGYFVVATWLYWEEDRKWKASKSSGRSVDDLAGKAIDEWVDRMECDGATRKVNKLILGSFFTVMAALLELSVDPYPEVASLAQTIVDYIMALLIESPFARLPTSSLHLPGQLSGPVRPATPRHRMPAQNGHSHFDSPPKRAPLTRTETSTSTVSMVSQTLKRTSSFAAALKSLATGYAFPSTDDARATSSNHHAPSKLKTSIEHHAPEPNLNLAKYSSPYSRPASPDPPRRYSVPSSPSSYSVNSIQHDPQPPSFGPVDVIEALLEEDYERLRARRRARKGKGSESTDSDSIRSITLGCGTGANLQDVLPLRSKFYDFAAEYFTEPHMRQQEADEPGSVAWNQQNWRRQRNEKIVAETSTQAETAPVCPWDRSVASLMTTGPTLKMAFHSFDSHLISSNESDMISVWDWSKRKLLYRFCNGNPKHSTITSLMFMNEEVGGIILAGSAEGIVRLYRNYDPAYDTSGVQMVSSFRAIPELISMKRGSGLICHWSQTSGTLTVGGDSRQIKIWSADHEAIEVEYPTNSESPLTALAYHSPATFVAGFADGAIRVYDKRAPPVEAQSRIYRDHTTWIQNIRCRRMGAKNMMSASIDGEVRLWDIRSPTPMTEHWNLFPTGLSTFDVHDGAGVFAASSCVTPVNWRAQTTKVYSLAAGYHELSRISLPTGLHHAPSRVPLSAYIPSSTSLAFHPHEMLYGIGGPDGTIKIMGCKLVERQGGTPRRFELPPNTPSYEGLGTQSLAPIRSVSS